MKTIIIDNILTPYEIGRYNKINTVLKGKLEVWFINEKEANGNWTKFPNIQFHYVIFRNAIKLLELKKLLERKRGVIGRIVCCGWDSVLYYYALLYCKRNNIRFTLWSGSTHFEKSLKRSLFSPLVKWVIRNSTDYIAYGIRAKKYLISLGASGVKIKIFLNSVDVDFFLKHNARLKKNRDSLRKKLKYLPSDFIYIYVGQLIDRKGVLELINAFIEYGKSNINSKLLIAGDGPFKESLLNLCIRHKSKNIHFIGFIQYEKLPEIYAVADALILPSKEEVWGLVVNEALASKIPVIVSRFAGCSDDLVTKRTGVSIQKITSEGIIHALDRIHQQKYLIPEKVIDKMRNTKYAYENFKE